MLQRRKLFLAVILVCPILYSNWLGAQGLSIFKNERFTGYGTLIGNFTADSKNPKFLKVDTKLKQRILIQFLDAEKLSRSDIQQKLTDYFGKNTVNVNVQETPTELSRRQNLHYNVVERVIIQYLSAQGVRPVEIFRRLRKVSHHGQHVCNVYRWVHKFRNGRSNVANLPAIPPKRNIRKTVAPKLNKKNSVEET